METLNTHIVLINLPEESDPYPLFVTTDFDRALAMSEQVKNNWRKHGEERDVWVLTHEIKSGVMFDYDWLHYEESEYETTEDGFEAEPDENYEEYGD